jgi:hypothetical protein
VLSDFLFLSAGLFGHNADVMLSCSEEHVLAGFLESPVFRIVAPRKNVLYMEGQSLLIYKLLISI